MGRLLLVCLVAGLAAGAATARPASALPPKQFQARANALCTNYYRDLISIAQRIRPQDLAGLATFQRTAHARAVRFVRDLERLAPPRAAAVRFRRMVALIKKSNALDAPIIAAAKRGDRAALSRLLAREKALDGPLIQLARSLSLTACASPPQ